MKKMEKWEETGVMKLYLWLMRVSVAAVVVALASVVSSSVAIAGEKPIGLPQTAGGMEIAAVYLQPIEMEPTGGPHAMRARKDADIHLEADIAAAAGNPNGFGVGEWIPYLTIGYKLVKEGSGETIKGMMGAMVASDGPHYGDNVKLAGLGKYKLTITIANPEKAGFGRHTDKETGVGKWFKPVTVSYDFTYLGVGKKGGY